ncbi:MAG: hypothetical protein ABIN80_19425 [Dyadobacter sp.]|uniref:Uncharacterized protein n=1 Tax=Dyadobacter pollutisoli TaxID=2910158 RepID=A0A9E8SIY2_9BACT|nr:hypothetical protein [Dyadobacter pollutisoli]WAC10740.1 hypothetical protein ON006_23725 [Dyadobacter pollutisoli]
MKTFSSIEEAFDWWVKNLYPTLTPEMKKGKAVQAMQDYIYERGISEKRMKEILVEYGHFEIETIVRYKP